MARRDAAMTSPNYSDAERELQRVEEIEEKKAVKDRTSAIVEVADRIRAWIHEDRIEVADTSRTPGSLWECCLEYDRVRALPAEEPEPAPTFEMQRQLAQYIEEHPGEVILESDDVTVPIETWSIVKGHRLTKRYWKPRHLEVRRIGEPAPPAPAWTRTPPSEPGLYFLRGPGDAFNGAPGEVRTSVVEVRRLGHRDVLGAWLLPSQCRDESFFALDRTPDGFEWWPVPLQPPEET